MRVANRKGTTGGSRITSKENLTAENHTRKVETVKAETPELKPEKTKARYDQIHAPDDTFPGSGPNHPER